MSVQAPRPEAAIKGLNERIIRWPSRSAEVQGDAVGVHPWIEIARDELRSLIHAIEPDGQRDVDGGRDGALFDECPENVGVIIAPCMHTIVPRRPPS